MNKNAKDPKTTNSFNDEQEAMVFAVEHRDAGERLDKYVTESMEDGAVSRTQVQDWIKGGAGVVNGRSEGEL